MSESTEKKERIPGKRSIAIEHDSSNDTDFSPAEANENDMSMDTGGDSDQILAMSEEQYRRICDGKGKLPYRKLIITKEKDFIACDNSNGDNVQRIFHDRAAAREWLHDLKRSKRLQREADLKTIQKKSDNSVILSPKEKLKAQLTQKIMAKAIDKGQQLALEVSEVSNK